MEFSEPSRRCSRRSNLLKPVKKVLEIVVASNPFIAGRIACRGWASQKGPVPTTCFLCTRIAASRRWVGESSFTPMKSPSRTRFRQFELPALGGLRHSLGVEPSIINGTIIRPTIHWRNLSFRKLKFWPLGHQRARISREQQ
jgi:hypothetical protein